MGSIEDVFAITDSYSLNYGCTVIDEKLNSGHEMITSSSKTKVMSPSNALYFYPEIINLQEELNVEGAPLATSWINGFAHVSTSVSGLLIKLSVEGKDKKIGETILEKGILTSNQIVSVRSEDVLNTIFANFKWFGGKRIVEEHKIDNSTLENVILKNGMVSRNWKSDPPEIRFMIRQPAFYDENKNAIPDYLYLIGGSESFVHPNKAIENIQKVFTGKSINLDPSEDYWKVAGGTSVNPNKIIYKICYGIIMIRNYLIYAKEYLGVQKVVDINHKRTKKFINKDIDEIINLYEPAYNYCKNLTLIFNL